MLKKEAFDPKVEVLRRLFPDGVASATLNRVEDQATFFPLGPHEFWKTLTALEFEGAVRKSSVFPGAPQIFECVSPSCLFDPSEEVVWRNTSS